MNTVKSDTIVNKYLHTRVKQLRIKQENVNLSDLVKVSGASLKASLDKQTIVKHRIQVHREKIELEKERREVEKQEHLQLRMYVYTYLRI